MSHFVKDNFYDDTVTKFDNDIKLESLPNYYLSEEYGLITIKRTKKSRKC